MNAARASNSSSMVSPGQPTKHSKPHASLNYSSVAGKHPQLSRAAKQHHELPSKTVDERERVSRRYAPLTNLVRPQFQSFQTCWLKAEIREYYTRSSHGSIRPPGGACTIT